MRTDSVVVPMRARMFFALSVAAVLAGCDADLSHQLEVRQREAEFQQLGQLKGLLTAAPLVADIEIFLSAPMLNSALKQIGPVKVAVPELGDASLTISDATIAFSNGYPALSIKATVDSPKRGISAECVTSAVLYLDTSPKALDKSTFRVVIKDIAPKVKLGFLEFKVRGFWKDLAAVAAQGKLANLPTFSVPLSATAPVSFGGSVAMTIPTGNDSTVTGTLSIPAATTNIAAHLQYVLFLADGVHFYLNTEIK